MATPEQGIIQLLDDDSAVTGIVGDRIFPDFSVQETAWPFLVVSRISVDHIHHMEGSSGFAIARIQVDGWSHRASQIQDLAEKVRLALDSVIGIKIEIDDDDTIVFSLCLLDSDTPRPLPPQQAGDEPIRNFMHDYKVGFVETVPTH